MDLVSPSSVRVGRKSLAHQFMDFAPFPCKQGVNSDEEPLTCRKIVKKRVSPQRPAVVSQADALQAALGVAPVPLQSGAQSRKITKCVKAERAQKQAKRTETAVKKTHLKTAPIAMKSVSIEKAQFHELSDQEIVGRAVAGVASDKGAKLKMTVECVTSRAYDRTVAGLKGSRRSKKNIAKIARRAYGAAKKASLLIRN